MNKNEVHVLGQNVRKDVRTSTMLENGKAEIQTPDLKEQSHISLQQTNRTADNLLLWAP